MRTAVKNRKGFTLIELLIVIAIIAILAAVVFVALDPLQRFQDARDARRWSDVDAIVSAIKLAQVDNGGNYPTAFRRTTENSGPLTNQTWYMIGNATTQAADNAVSDSTACDVTCDTGIGTIDYCMDFEEGLGVDSIVTDDNYLASIPESPDDGTNVWDIDTNGTGYVIRRNGNNVEVAACNAEEDTLTIIIKR